MVSCCHAVNMRPVSKEGEELTLVLIDHSFGGEQSSLAPLPGLPKGLREVTVISECVHRGRDSAHVAGWHQNAGAAVLDNLWHASNLCSYGRTPDRHRLKENHRQGFHIARQTDRVCGMYEIRNIIPSAEWEQPDASDPTRLVTQRLKTWAPAGQDPANTWIPGTSGDDRLKKYLHSLFGPKPSDHQDQKVLLGDSELPTDGARMSSRRDVVRSQPIPDDRDSLRPIASGNQRRNLRSGDANNAMCSRGDQPNQRRLVATRAAHTVLCREMTGAADGCHGVSCDLCAWPSRDDDVGCAVAQGMAEPYEIEPRAKFETTRHDIRRDKILEESATPIERYHLDRVAAASQLRYEQRPLALGAAET